MQWLKILQINLKSHYARGGCGSGGRMGCPLIAESAINGPLARHWFLSSPSVMHGWYTFFLRYFFLDDGENRLHLWFSLMVAWPGSNLRRECYIPWYILVVINLLRVGGHHTGNLTLARLHQMKFALLGVISNSILHKFSDKNELICLANVSSVFLFWMQSSTQPHS